MIENVMKWLNAFPSKGGISKTMSPAMLLEEKLNPDMNKKHIILGSHAMVFVGSNNTMSRRSVPAIALNESNEHGGHYFMNLYSGKRIHSYEWREIPIDDETIAQVENIAKNEKNQETYRSISNV